MGVDDRIIQEIGKLGGTLEEVRRDVQSLVKCVKDGNAKPGLMTRVDRLEQARKHTQGWRRLWIVPFVAAIVGLVVSRVWAWLKV